jgi:hypothetical protein
MKMTFSFFFKLSFNFKGLGFGLVFYLHFMQG